MINLSLGFYAKFNEILIQSSKKTKLIVHI